MGRINTNVAALISQHRLGRSQRDLSVTLERLSSGLRINRGADDPAGLIASENLRSEIGGVKQAIDNSQRAINVIATAEGSLNEVAAMLVDIQRLVVQAANSGAMSPDEIKANQLQIDSAIDSITRIANTTTFAGLRLLDGSLDYQTTGVSAADIQSLQIHRANFGTRSAIPVSIEVTQSAQKAGLYFLGAGIASASTIEVKGKDGGVSIVLNASAKASAIMAAVNNQTDVTGVKAEYITASNPASGIIFRSVEYGSDAFVSVKALTGGAFTVKKAPGDATGVEIDEGQDAEATINGHRSVGRGLELSLNTTSLDMTVRLAEAFGTGTTSFAITGGGALFQLGPKVDSNQQVNVGIQSVAASRLGNGVVGYLSQIGTDGDYSLLVDGGARQASLIVKEAIRQVSVLRGRLGSFERNTLQTNVNALNITMENLTSAESSIRDADFAAETANLTRSQILVQAGTSVLSMANSTPQSVLSLLGGR